jgi:hypothetical protein
MAPGPGVIFFNANDKELDVAFPASFDRLAFMKFTAYSYWWRFTFRVNRQRGAIV